MAFMCLRYLMSIKFYFSIDCGMIYFKSDGMEIFDIKGEFEGYLGFLYIGEMCLNFIKQER